MDWLAAVPHDKVAAMRGFLDVWYADVPTADPTEIDSPVPLPAALTAFYERATRKPVIFGVHNSVYPPHELEYDEDEGGVVFAAENQGAWAKVIDPDDEDPEVYDDGEPDPEPLSGVLLQFALVEAVMSAPYATHEEVTRAERDELLTGLTRVPLSPASFPEHGTLLYAGPGVVALSYQSEAGHQVLTGRRRRQE
ncbi:hypothetical protein GCM10009828_051970 [Actinoplanes couchii]|uniref:Uncharacterized protein n=2 Tax=Actinoplanes couchii TaxID=403638 RepID=A0ABQ3XNC3_9ACTN|nr:hypothetical protein Aco03nite_084050 [Actinoplanes couchii]